MLTQKTNLSGIYHQIYCTSNILEVRSCYVNLYYYVAVQSWRNVNSERLYSDSWGKKVSITSLSKGIVPYNLLKYM